MKYLNQFHKQKTERCLKRIQNWLALPMTSEEQRNAIELMKRNMALGEKM
ncbi:MAG: hypothetical protein PUH57_04085 [Prevotellaceae bacterium]|nr:hypothetical protein [Prevotella sp.]MDD7247294.1 hypothetical protein [Prevotellaceae bacterium]MDY2750000.1 hypothetical protein [Prevotella sp.]